jgi:hypothetical protein
MQEYTRKSGYGKGKIGGRLQETGKKQEGAPFGTPYEFN